MNREELAKVALAVHDLPTVRRPLPEHIDQVGLQRDINQIKRLLDRDMEDSARLMSYLSEVIILTRLFFNRSVQQTTVPALVDLTLVALPATGVSEDELTDFVTAIYYYCEIIAAYDLCDSGDALGIQYVAAIRSQHPALTLGLISDSDADSRLAMGLDNGFFKQPLVLVAAGLTPFYSQKSELAVDFNEFIAQIQQKNDPALLNAALLFFLGDEEPVYFKILQLARQTNPADSRLVLLWRQPKTVSWQANVVLLQSYQAFFDFCANKKLITPAEANKMQRFAVDYLLTSLYHDQEQVAAFSNQIFTGKDQGLNLAKVQQVLQAHPYSVSEWERPRLSYPLALKKVLDQHQLDLELANAQAYLRDLVGDVSAAELPELQLFSDFILEIHRTMVTKYHRRVSQWTHESLQDCLMTMLNRHDQLVNQPTILRFLQLYLFTLDDVEAIKNVDVLLFAVEHTADSYLCHSIDVLTR